MTQRFLHFLLLLLCALPLCGQVAIGHWRSHLPANRFEWVGELATAYYVANPYGIHKLDKRDQSVSALNKVTGLSSTSISCFGCSPENGVCIAGYSDGNLDILTEDQSVQNQRAILNAPILGDKAVHHVQFIGNRAYLSTGIAIVILELEDFTVLDHATLKEQDETVQFLETKLFHDTLFAITNNGLRAVPFDRLTQFQAPWVTYNLPDAAEDVQHLFSNGNSLFAVHKTGRFNNDSLLVKSGDSFEYSTLLTDIGINAVQETGDSLLLTHPTAIKLYDRDFQNHGTIFAFNAEGGMLPQAASFVSNGQVLVADLLWGGVLTSFQDQYASTLIRSSSPSSHHIGGVTIAGDDVYAFASGNEFTFNNPIVHVLSNNEWRSYDVRNNTYRNLRNITELSLVDDEIFISMEGEGIARLENFSATEQFKDSNSAIQDGVPNNPYDYYGMTDMVADEEGNLWMLNNIVKKPLVVRYSDGTWASLDIGIDNPKTSEIIQLGNGFLACILIERGILVYDYNDTPKDLSDDRYINLTSDPAKGDLPSNLVTSIAEDNDGELWIGTDAGIVVIYNPGDVFDAGFTGAERIIVNQGGHNGHLFETELVDAIAVDGADRKWVGTSTSGLFLISADGTEQLQHFTEDNSPLFSNKVVDIEIHSSTGEVFVTTDKGLISYRSDATASQPDLEQLYIFPNPVKPSYSGTIAISNLFDGTHVRITDASGNLVHETTSLGGQATWNGTDLNGARVQSGVYLVFAVKPDGTQGKVGKLLFLH